MNSKRKGKRGELEACEALRATFGCEARRGQQFCGSPDSPDVTHSIHGVHFEVKRTERLKIYLAVEQAADECGNDVPIVIHKANHKPWLAVVRLEDLPRLAGLLEKHRAEQNGKKRPENRG